MAGRTRAQLAEVPVSEAIYISEPAEVAEIVEKAAEVVSFKQRNYASITKQEEPQSPITGDVFYTLAGFTQLQKLDAALVKMRNAGPHATSSGG
jgi:hypothetical protein